MSPNTCKRCLRSIQKGGLPPLNSHHHSSLSPTIQLETNCSSGRAVYPRSTRITTQASVPQFKFRSIAAQEGRFPPAQLSSPLKPQSHNSSSDQLQVRKGGLPPLNSHHHSSLRPTIQLETNCRSGRAVYPRSTLITTQPSVPQFNLKPIAAQEGRFTP